MRHLTGDFHFRRVGCLPAVEFLHVKGVTFTFPRHIHDAHSIGVMLQGQETVTTVVGSHIARPGDLLLINAEQPHANQSFQTTYLVMKIRPEALQEVGAQITGCELPIAPFATPVTKDRVVYRAICQFHSAVEESASELCVQSLFVSLLALVVERRLLRPRSYDPTPSRRHVAAARDYLRTEYARSVSLADLARIANLSAFHLVRMFRQEFGIAPHEYQLQLRIGRARRLLRKGHAIADIAAETGFCDQSHFSRHFKRIVAMTPGEYAGHSKIVQDIPASMY